ncbi:ribonuclease III [Candidatus Saccharibacteria bacterium]|nr:ribonuclease III [Candidatus Saccharibacteria bacterium]
MNKELIEEYQNFAKEKLGFEFHDINLLITALTHRSYVNEHKKSGADHNERLEFLGDAILELVTSDFLFHNYHQPEGIMTAWRSALVRTESIGAAGEELGYGPLVRLSNGEKMGSERAFQVIMADCFEAVIGAIYLDQGYDAAKKFIEKHILVKIDQVLEEGTWRDPKSYYQEIAQHHDGITPSYRLMKEEGPDHDKVFTIGVYVGADLRGVGTGHSKQEAQGSAALSAIKKFRVEHPEEFKRKNIVKDPKHQVL